MMEESSLKIAIIIAIVLMASAAQGATVVVEQNQSIQAAIDGAAAGDLIEIHSGIYRESLDVNRPVTLRGIGSPVIDASGVGNAITLSAGSTTLQGFSVTTDTGSGIRVVSSQNTVTDINASNNRDFGIAVERCSGNNITGNIVYDNMKAGIFLTAASKNIIAHNNATGNSYGILVVLSEDNLFFNNRLVGNNVNAEDDGSNQWDNGIRGNYYSDFKCSDADSDGICDAARSIPGGTAMDWHPLYFNNRPDL